MTDQLPTVDIKGKDYVLVKDRILYFNEKYPNGAIQTGLHSYENGHVIVRAVVTPDVENLNRQFTGFSQAKENDGYINKSSALENAETSAVGRALAMMGIGVIESIASADEMVKAGATAPRPAPTTHEPEVEADDEPSLDGAEEDIEVKDIRKDYCSIHGVAMRARQGSYGTFWSHGEQKPDGTWKNCSGKGYKE